MLHAALVFYLYFCILFPCLNIPQFIHSTDNEYLDCLLFGVIINNSTMNIIIDVFWLYVLEFLLGIYLGLEFLGHRECIFSNLWIMTAFLSD